MYIYIYIHTCVCTSCEILVVTIISKHDSSPILTYRHSATASVGALLLSRRRCRQARKRRSSMGLGRTATLSSQGIKHQWFGLRDNWHRKAPVISWENTDGFPDFPLNQSIENRTFDMGMDENQSLFHWDEDPELPAIQEQKSVQGFDPIFGEQGNL